MTPDHKRALERALLRKDLFDTEIGNLAAAHLELTAENESLRLRNELQANALRTLGAKLADLRQKAKASLDANDEFIYREGSVPSDRAYAAQKSLDADAALRAVLAQGE